MALKPTPTQQRLYEAMKAAIASGDWTAISGETIRWSSEERACPTRMFGWTGPYKSHVFLTLLVGRRGCVIVRIAKSPWMGAQDMVISYKLAFQILADPEPALSGLFNYRQSA